MRGRSDPTAILHELVGSHRYILDYLTDEVLRQQPPALQTFLLHNSILERLCASLCDSVMGQSGSQFVLEQLEQANLFVGTLDGRREWYRYHALFAEVLRYRLEQAEAEAVPVLHLRTSQWYAERGYLNEAVRLLRLILSGKKSHCFSQGFLCTVRLLCYVPVTNGERGEGSIFSDIARRWI